MSKPIHAQLIRDFATCEDKGSFPLVSRVSKCRNAETYSCSTDLGFRIPRFRDLRRLGILPFGFPGAEMSKHIHAKSMI
jgi:hypothetical protein